MVVFFDCKLLVIPAAARELSAVLCSTVSGTWWSWSWSRTPGHEVHTSMRWVQKLCCHSSVVIVGNVQSAQTVTLMTSISSFSALGCVSLS